MVWPLTDHLGTARDLATYDAVTDTTTVANHRVYDSFGKLVSETNAAVDHLFGFTGRPFDEATGLQNNLHRWYNAETGTWMSEDPIGFAAGDENLRRYVGSSPTDATDPYGLFEKALTPNRGVWVGERGNSWYKPPGRNSKPILFQCGEPIFDHTPGAVYTYRKVEGRVDIVPDQSPINAKDADDYKSILKARRDKDMTNADAAFRKKIGKPGWPRPRGYTWHHETAGGGMVLVKTSVHRAAVPHFGGFGANIRNLVDSGKVRIGGKVKGALFLIALDLALESISEKPDYESAIVDSFPLFGGAVSAEEIKKYPHCPTPAYFIAIERREAHKMQSWKDTWKGYGLDAPAEPSEDWERRFDERYPLARYGLRGGLSRGAYIQDLYGEQGGRIGPPLPGK